MALGPAQVALGRLLDRPKWLLGCSWAGRETSGGSPDAPEAAQLLRRLDSRELRDRQVFALSARQLLYFLSARVSPLEEFELGLYLLRSGGLSDAGVVRLLDEERMIAALQASRPLVLDDVYDDASERILARLPRLAHYLRTRYAPVARIGGFEILDLQVPPPAGGASGSDAATPKPHGARHFTP